MSNKSSKQRFGIFYRSHGKWTGPYAGLTFTQYSLSRKPVSSDIKWLKNRTLKQRIQLRPVKA